MTEKLVVISSDLFDELIARSTKRLEKEVREWQAKHAVTALEWHKLTQHEDGTISGMPTEEGREVLVKGKTGWYCLDEAKYVETYIAGKEIDEAASGWFFDCCDAEDVEAWAYPSE